MVTKFIEQRLGCDIVEYFKDAALDVKRYAVIEHDMFIATDLLSVDSARDVIDEMSAHI